MLCLQTSMSLCANLIAANVCVSCLELVQSEVAHIVKPGSIFWHQNSSLVDDQIQIPAHNINQVLQAESRFALVKSRNKEANGMMFTTTVSIEWQ